jgi:hypothetical protein
MSGVLKLLSIASDGYRVELIGGNANWFDGISDTSIRRIGYVNDQPTWTIPYEGAKTANSLNLLDNSSTDIVFPTILYNNTPWTDYINIGSSQIFGTYDTSGNKLADTELEFPRDFRVFPAYYSAYQGMTFEDFPPAVFYKNLLLRCFAESGYAPAGQLLNEPWFNKLIMPYVGEGYKWNWRTLAELGLDLSTVSFPPIMWPLQTYETYNRTIGANSYYFGKFEALNDNVNNRVDRVANFEKWNTDPNTYIAPATGKYKITVDTELKVTLLVDGTQSMKLNSFNNALISDVSQAMLVVQRENEVGDLVVNPNYLQDLSEFMAGLNVNFINDPSDVVAYCSPWAATIYPSSNIRVSGSPLTLWQNPVNVVATNHSSTVTPVGIDFLYEFTSRASIEIEVDLVRNERLKAFWFAPVRFEDLSANGTTTSSIDINVGAFSGLTATVNYLCGEQDLNIADNLPDKTCKEFVSDFINFFNMSFDVDEASKTVNFYTQRDVVGSGSRLIDISSRVVSGSEVVLPVTSLPRELKIGYDNDSSDRLVGETIVGCTNESTTRGTDYANVTFRNDNVYSTGNRRLTNGFSATRFTDGVFELTDLTGAPFPGTPVTKCSGAIPPECIVAGYDFLLNQGSSLVYQVPSIQTEQQFLVDRLGDLEYFSDSTPRLVYHEGRADQTIGAIGAFRVNAYDNDAVDSPLWENAWMYPTVSSFDGENGSQLPTLRFDTGSGLYNRYFNEVVSTLTQSHFVRLDAYLTVRQWNAIKASSRVKVHESLYTVYEIKDYDITGENPTELILLKVV